MRGHTKMILGTVIILALVGLYPHTSQAADVESIQIVDFGIYKTAFERWEAAPSTGKGKIKIVSDRKLLCLTDRIAAAPGTEIGVRYVVNGKDQGKPVDVLVKVIQAGGGAPATEQWLRVRQVGSASFEGWKLDSGSARTITIQLHHEGRKMAEKSFTLQGTHQAKGLGFNG
ncbi:MAG: hypothetical protein ACM3MN_03595 [Nitrospirota bacterium]